MANHRFKNRLVFGRASLCYLRKARLEMHDRRPYDGCELSEAARRFISTDHAINVAQIHVLG